MPNDATNIEVEAIGDLDFQDTLVVIAFPTTGSAASIAAQYLLRRLDLPLVGHMRGPGIRGVTVIGDGHATSPIRIYGGEVLCKLPEGCPRMHVVTTELALPPEILVEVADGLLRKMAEQKPRMVLCLEGVVRDEGDETPDVYRAAADPKTLQRLETTQAPVTIRALIAGVTADLLLGGRAQGIPVGALMAEANARQPDGRAAAALVAALDPLMPEVEVDYEPLLAEAMELEKEIQQQQAAAERAKSPQRQSTPTFI